MDFHARWRQRARSRSPQELSAQILVATAAEEEIGALKIKISRLHQCVRPPPCGSASAFSASKKKGGELYQITVGGDATENASVGSDPRPRLSRRRTVPDAVERLVDAYIAPPAAGAEPGGAVHPRKPSCRLGNEAPFKA